MYRTVRRKVVIPKGVNIKQFLEETFNRLKLQGQEIRKVDFMKANVLLIKTEETNNACPLKPTYLVRTDTNERYETLRDFERAVKYTLHKELGHELQTISLHKMKDADKVIYVWIGELDQFEDYISLPAKSSIAKVSDTLMKYFSVFEKKGLEIINVDNGDIYGLKITLARCAKGKNILHTKILCVKAENYDGSLECFRASMILVSGKKVPHVFYTGRLDAVNEKGYSQEYFYIIVKEKN